MKRKLLTFTNKISKHLSKPNRKFTADITYGILASGSCLLTDVVDQLHEKSKKINIVDRLSRHLDKGFPPKAAVSYLQQIKKWVPSELVITNKEIKSKEDVIKVARTYFSRWKIEEYFRCKKQMFQFEPCTEALYNQRT